MKKQNAGNKTRLSVKRNNTKPPGLIMKRKHPMLRKLQPLESVKLTQFIETLKCLLCALCLMTLVGCSQKPSLAQTPQLPENLSAPCQPLPTPPDPLVDPERAVWEAMLISLYGDCALRHRITVEIVND